MTRECTMADLPPLPELCFAEIPTTSRHRYVGDRFCYMETGRVDLPPVLLLHGIGANSLHWRYQLAGLADCFRLIAWNAPGYLLSDNLRAETPRCRDYADALDDLLAALGVGRFDIVANSFGTRVAQCFAYHRPGRIKRAVFTGTSIPDGTPPEERARTVEARGRRRRLVHRRRTVRTCHAATGRGERPLFMSPASPPAAAVAAGTNLIDLMKYEVDARRG